MTIMANTVADAVAHADTDSMADAEIETEARSKL